MGKGWSIKTWRSGKKGPLYLTLALPTGMVVGKPSGHAWDVKVEHKEKSGVRSVSCLPAIIRTLSRFQM